MKEKFKRVINRVKVVVTAAAVACMSLVTCVAASAEDVTDTTTATSTQMTEVLTDAGAQLTTMFGDMVTTIIPVILGILGSGLIIFAIFALIKLAKKIFGKVAG